MVIYRQMKNPDKFFYDLIMRIGQQSKCKGRQVGCLLVRDEHIIGQGYNGAPIGTSCEDCPRPRCKGMDAPVGASLDQAICAHAEANGIGFCARHGISTLGATVYLPIFPCTECAKLIVAAGIKEVVYEHGYTETNDRWANFILTNAKISIRKFQL